MNIVQTKNESSNFFLQFFDVTTMPTLEPIRRLTPMTAIGRFEPINLGESFLIFNAMEVPNQFLNISAQF